MGEVELRIRAVDQGPDFGATGAGGRVDLALDLEVTFFGGIVKRESEGVERKTSLPPVRVL